MIVLGGQVTGPCAFTGDFGGLYPLSEFTLREFVPAPGIFSDLGGLG